MNFTWIQGETKMGKLDYLKQFESRNTVTAYKTALKKYFQTIYGEKIENGELETIAEKYFTEKRNFMEDVQRFAVEIKRYAPKSRKLFLSAVRIFLLENGVELPQLFWRRLRKRIKGGRAISEEKIPSRDELKQIFMHLPLQGRALFLLLLSSGMRIGEALKLKLNDIDFKSSPVKITIKAEYTKSGIGRISFISDEAAEAVKEWLKIRDEYLKTAVKRSGNRKKGNDERLFPFTSQNAGLMWRLALKKTGNYQKDPRTQRTLIHPHCLRKYFRAVLGVKSRDLTQTLMGHQEYLDEVYRKYPNPEKTLGDFYRENMHLLTVFSNSENVEKLKMEIEEKNRQLQEIINSLIAENMVLKEKLKKIEEAVGKLMERIGVD